MNRIEAKTFRFTRLTLKNWRNFKAADLELNRRAFLVGPNASGKSNVLDALRFLSEIVSVGGGIQAALENRGGLSSIRSFAARTNPEVSVAISVGNDEDANHWSYELVLRQNRKQAPFVIKEVVKRGDKLLLERPDNADVNDKERLTQTHIEQVNTNQQFRALCDFLQSVRYLHIVPQLVKEPDRVKQREDDPFGTDFLERIARTSKRTQESRLKRIRSALSVAVPQLKELGLERDVRGVPHLRGNYEHWRARGAWQNESRFSDGTLRLMGLLWASVDGSGPLLLEEPELSLHPGVVRYIPSMFARVQRSSGRQIVMSTHSAELLSDENIDASEVFILIPESEGTSVRNVQDDVELRRLLDAGISLEELILSRTAPKYAKNLTLFSE